MTKISAQKGDITKIKVDAIVNAANESLLGGGGVDGAIHGASGPELLKECKALGGCRTGEAKITKGYGLPARFVIHTVGPVYGSAGGRESELLASCYKNCLKLAKKHGIRSVAFCAISTGAYGYPKEAAAKIAVKTVKEYVNRYPGDFEELVFMQFDDESNAIYEKILGIDNRNI